MDVRADREEKTYQTGGGGTLQARRAGMIAFVTVCFGVGLWAGSTDLSGANPLADTPPWGFWMAGTIVFVGIALGGFGMVCGLRERNSQVRVSPDGLTIRDWMGHEATVTWEDIRAVVWQHRHRRILDEGYTLIIHAEDADGFVVPLSIGYSHYVPADDLLNLRDELVSRRNLSPAHPTAPGPWEKLADLLHPAETQVWK